MAQVPIGDKDLANIQGDILVGIPKNTQDFYFFSIEGTKISEFKVKLGELIPLITTTKGTQQDRDRIVAHKRSRAKGLVALAELNIAFSRTGLDKLGFNKEGDKIGDPVFDAGMQTDITNLGDNKDLWLPEFVSVDDTVSATDGVILIGGDSHESIQQGLDGAKAILGNTVEEIFRIRGDTRPAPQRGHEHFGFMDDIVQPAVIGFNNNPLPGQDPVPSGIFLLGRDNDPVSTRPEWAKNGSFLAFRQLAQRVPEFDAFLTANAIVINDPSLPADHGKELLGARMVGRWKSGAPVDLAPLKDDTDLANDENRNDLFRFENDTDPPERCPFAAHIRKTNPRSDLDDFGGTSTRRIIRRGIPFGIEVTEEEKASHTTKQHRGLLFVCYQSVLANGFQFIQQSWANAPGFIFGKSQQPGFDPIIGQNSDDTARETAGLDPANAAGNTILGTKEWVVSEGGEYYFSPSIKGLKTFAGIA